MELTKKWNVIAEVKDQIKKTDLLFFENMIQSGGLEIFSRDEKEFFYFTKDKRVLSDDPQWQTDPQRKIKELVGSFFKPNIKLFSVPDDDRDIIIEHFYKSEFDRYGQFMPLSEKIRSLIKLSSKNFSEKKVSLIIKIGEKSFKVNREKIEVIQPGFTW
ncbi:MAG: hypothetical protein WC414_00755 [Patescibacteria group bacterium]